MDILTWLLRFVGFWLWYLKEFVVANVAVIRDIISRGHDSTPGVAVYESRSFKPGHYTLFAALVTITPGTLVVGAGATKDNGVRVLYVHGMYNDSADDLRAELVEMEERMLKGIMFRPRLNEAAQ